MLEKNKRVRLKKDFENVFKKGKGLFEDSLGLKIVKNNLEFNRFGVIVSNKVSKKAVIRNRIKRQIRSILRMEELKLKVGYDSVILTQKEILKKNFQEIQKTISRLLNKNKQY